MRLKGLKGRSGWGFRSLRLLGVQGAGFCLVYGFCRARKHRAGAYWKTRLGQKNHARTRTAVSEGSARAVKPKSTAKHPNQNVKP